MSSTTSQATMLRILINKFTNIVFIDPEELELFHIYIFSETSASVFDDNSELYQTVNDLKYIVEDNQFTDLCQLKNYFDSQENELVEVVQPFLTNDVPDPNLSELINDYIKTNPWKILQHEIPRNSSDYSKILNQLYRSFKLKGYLSQKEQEYKNINIFSLCLKSLHSLVSGSGCYQYQILPNTDHYYYKRYFESFSVSTKGKSKFIYFIKFLKSCKKNISFKFFRNKKSGIANYHKRERHYKIIFKSIQLEKPIIDEQFKTSLSRLMLTSKLNNPVFRNKNKDFTLKILTKLYYKQLLEKRWSILKSPEGEGWITSDNPGISINLEALNDISANLESDPFWTRIDENCMIYFPLSKDYCLRLQPPSLTPIERQNDSTLPVSFEISSLEEVHVVNSLIFSSKPEIVISESKGIQIHG